MGDDDYSNRIPDWKPLSQRMIEMLRELEYIRVATGRDGDRGPPFCPCCMHVVSEYEPKGRHADGCRLAALLSELT